MIQVRCHTNLDFKYPEEWPTVLPCLPRVGDIITSKAGLELQVCRVVFPYCTGELDDERVYGGRIHHCASVPPVKIEMNLVPNRFRSIAEFNEWERKRFEPKEIRHE